MRTLFEPGGRPIWPHDGGIRLGFVTEKELRGDNALQTPEINSGFMPCWWLDERTVTRLDFDPDGAAAYPDASLSRDEIAGRAVPLWFKAELGAGRFLVRAELTADIDCPEALLFVSRRRLCRRGAIKAGERVTVEALCDVSPILPAGHSGLTDTTPGPTDDTTIDVVLVGHGARLVRVEAERSDVPALFLMGDSTVTDQRADVPYAPGACYAGWGQMLPAYLGTEYCVSNHAHSGLTTESFRAEGHYDNMRPLIRPGDLVLMQFGHNDQKQPNLSARTGYTDNLTRYADELRSVGARPVFVTPLARNTWSTAETYNDLLQSHAEAVLELAEKLKVPVVDLHAAMVAALRKKGLKAAKIWFHAGDYTHTNDFGAWMAAGFVARELGRLGLAHPVDPGEWTVRGPLLPLMPPSDISGDAPSSAALLVDYGLMPDAPWKTY